MSFEATIFIQGVGIYQLQGESNGEADGLVVFFPNQATATGRGLEDDKGKELCDHEAKIQAEFWDQVSGKRTWLNRSFQDCEVELDVQFPGGGRPGFSYARTGNGSGIYGLPTLQDFLAETGWQNARIPTPPDEADLTGRLRIDTGALRPSSDFVGLWEVPGNPREQLLSSVMKIELGRVESFELLLTPFSGQTTRFPLQPRGDVLEVWIRHYCNMDWPPRPELDKIVAGKPDLDFVLNYALVPNLKNRLDDLRGKGRTLPVPRVHSSWIGGGPVGGDPSLCQGSSQGGG